MPQLIRHVLLLLGLLAATLLPGAVEAADSAPPAALDAQHQAERGQLANEEIRATADYQKQMVGCGTDRGCKEAATRQYHQRLREIEKKIIDADARWRIARARLAAANRIADLNPSDATGQCVRPLGAGSQQAALDAADATHVADRERVEEQQIQAAADHQKAEVDCEGEPPAGRAGCKERALAAYHQAVSRLEQQALEVDERWREARNTIQVINQAKRAAAAGHEDSLYRQGVQAGIVACAKQGASPLWTDPAAGVRIGSALALGRSAQLANLAGLAAVPGTLQSLQAAVCGPPAASQDPDPYLRGQQDGEAYCKWAAKLASGAIARTRAPLLAVVPDDGGKMLGEAMGYLKAAEPAQRIDLFQQFADQITAATGGGWTARRFALQAGGAMFVGDKIGETLVIDPAGNMFRGRIGNVGAGPDAQFNFGPGGTLVPNYPQLRPIN